MAAEKSNPHAKFLRAYRPNEMTHVAAKTIRKYQKVLPPIILKLWKEQGWGAFGDGFLWLHDPAFMEPVLNEWIIPTTDQPMTPFMRTVFGHIFYFRSAGSIQILDPHYRRANLCAIEADDFLVEYLCNRDIRVETLWQDLFVKTQKRIGSPDSDEIYAFMPALAIGGSKKPANLQRVKFREHMSFLRQL